MFRVSQTHVHVEVAQQRVKEGGREGREAIGGGGGLARLRCGVEAARLGGHALIHDAAPVGHCASAQVARHAAKRRSQSARRRRDGS